MASWGKVAQKIRVPAGTLLGTVFLLLMRPSVLSLWLGGVLAFAGAFLRIWASGHLEKGKVLARGGPYTWTRNPLYLGSFFMALGVLLAGRGYWLLIPFGVFYVTFYYAVMKMEEQELLQGYGEEFLEYARAVPLFFPSIRRTVDNPSTFLWSRVVKNREHRTFLILLLAEGFLIIRFMANLSPP